jgi:hypothetical protein
VNSKGTGSMCPRTIQLKFERYTKEMGTHIPPHTIRHTFAAHLARKGMPLACIQVLWGHNSPYKNAAVCSFIKNVQTLGLLGIRRFLIISYLTLRRFKAYL